MNRYKLLVDKEIYNVEVGYEDGMIWLKQYIDDEFPITKYDVKQKEMIGLSNEVSEDLRDYLRREGIKIYTDKPFKSIKQEWL